MSERHPIIAITGSSGAGTTSVTHTLRAHLPPRGRQRRRHRRRLFHRYDRDEMKERRRPPPSARATPTSATSGPSRTCSASWRRSSAATARPAPAMRRKYLHDDDEAAPLRPGAGHLHAAGRTCPPGTDLLFYEGLHGAVVTPEVDVARPVDLLIGVVPIINLEWIQKLHRDQTQRGYSHGGGDRHDPAAHARLRELHLPAVHAARTSTSSACRRWTPRTRSSPGHPDRRREHRRDPLRRPEGHRLPVPAVDAAGLVHVAGRTSSSCRAARWSSRCS